MCRAKNSFGDMEMSNPLELCLEYIEYIKGAGLSIICKNRVFRCVREGVKKKTVKKRSG